MPGTEAVTLKLPTVVLAVRAWWPCARAGKDKDRRGPAGRMRAAAWR